MEITKKRRNVKNENFNKSNKNHNVDKIKQKKVSEVEGKIKRIVHEDNHKGKKKQIPMITVFKNSGT
jgi:hypothetical protein